MEEGQHIELNYKEIDSLEREFQQVFKVRSRFLSNLLVISLWSDSNINTIGSTEPFVAVTIMKEFSTIKSLNSPEISPIKLLNWDSLSKCPKKMLRQSLTSSRSWKRPSKCLSCLSKGRRGLSRKSRVWTLKLAF